MRNIVSSTISEDNLVVIKLFSVSNELILNICKYCFIFILNKVH